MLDTTAAARPADGPQEVPLGARAERSVFDLWRGLSLSYRPQWPANLLLTTDMLEVRPPHQLSFAVLSLLLSWCFTSGEPHMRASELSRCFDAVLRGGRQRYSDLFSLLFTVKRVQMGLHACWGPLVARQRGTEMRWVQLLQPSVRE